MKRTEILTALMGMVIAAVGLYFLMKNIIAWDDHIPGSVLADVLMVAGGAHIAVRLRKDISDDLLCCKDIILGN